MTKRKSSKERAREMRGNKKKGYRGVMSYELWRKYMSDFIQEKKWSFQYHHLVIQGARPKPWDLEAPNLQAFSCHNPPREIACGSKRTAHLRPVPLPPSRSCCKYSGAQKSLPVRPWLACGACEGLFLCLYLWWCTGPLQEWPKSNCLGGEMNGGLTSAGGGVPEQALRAAQGLGGSQKWEGLGSSCSGPTNVRAWWPFPHKTVCSVTW